MGRLRKYLHNVCIDTLIIFRPHISSVTYNLTHIDITLWLLRLAQVSVLSIIKCTRAIKIKIITTNHDYDNLKMKLQSSGHYIGPIILNEANGWVDVMM